jgi:hypothetical protein
MPPALERPDREVREDESPVPPKGTHAGASDVDRAVLLPYSVDDDQVEAVQPAEGDAAEGRRPGTDVPQALEPPLVGRREALAGRVGILAPWLPAEPAACEDEREERQSRDTHDDRRALHRIHRTVDSILPERKSW